MIQGKIWYSAFTGSCKLHIFALLLVISLHLVVGESYKGWRCEDLLVGQYQCNVTIDSATQEILGCTAVRNFTGDGIANISCSPIKGIHCQYDLNGTLVWTNATTNATAIAVFNKSKECRYTNGYHYSTAISLSLFFGWLGLDRFYLGYPAIGLLKLCTFGLCGIGALADFLLIALQVVLPADQSNYVIDYYGPRLRHLTIDNDTYYRPPT